MPARGLHGVEFGVPGEVAFAYQTESEAIFAAFTTPPNDTRKGQIDAVVVALKTGGVWTTLDELQVHAAADSQAALINWKQPGTYNGTLVNAPAFVADRGFTGAATKYIDTNFNPTTATAPNYVRNSATRFAWSNTNIDIAAGIFGYATATVTGDSMLYPRSSGSAIAYINQSTSSSWANLDSSGLLCITRRGSASLEAYRNTTSLGTGTTASAVSANDNFVFLRRGAAAHWVGGQIAVGGFGSQLSAAQITTLEGALRTYLVAVGAA